MRSRERPGFKVCDAVAKAFVNAYHPTHASPYPKTFADVKDAICQRIAHTDHIRFTVRLERNVGSTQISGSRTVHGAAWFVVGLAFQLIQELTLSRRMVS